MKQFFNKIKDAVARKRLEKAILECPIEHAISTISELLSKRMGILTGKAAVASMAVTTAIKTNRTAVVDIILAINSIVESDGVKEIIKEFKNVAADQPDDEDEQAINISSKAWSDWLKKTKDDLDIKAKPE